uniref:Uncharacterized protein n=1 Tax=Anguilla anguilla TaxID=7936 RepID=A0A0E9UVF4_ANGAN
MVKGWRGQGFTIAYQAGVEH